MVMVNHEIFPFENLADSMINFPIATTFTPEQLVKNLRKQEAKTLFLFRGKGALTHKVKNSFFLFCTATALTKMIRTKAQLFRLSTKWTMDCNRWLWEIGPIPLQTSLRESSNSARPRLNHKRLDNFQSNRGNGNTCALLFFGNCKFCPSPCKFIRNTIPDNVSTSKKPWECNVWMTRDFITKSSTLMPKNGRWYNVRQKSNRSLTIKINHEIFKGKFYSNGHDLFRKNATKFFPLSIFF